MSLENIQYVDTASIENAFIEYASINTASFATLIEGTASNAVSASWAPAIPSDYSISSSWASSSLSSSYTTTASFALNTDIYVNIDGGSPFANYGGIQQIVNGGPP